MGSARTGGGHTFAERSRKVLCPGGLFHGKARNTHRIGGLFHGEAEKCARAGFRPVKSGLETFAEQSGEVCPAAVPGGGSVCPPGGKKPPARRKKTGFFFGPYAHV